MPAEAEWNQNQNCQSTLQPRHHEVEASYADITNPKHHSKYITDPKHHSKNIAKLEHYVILIAISEN